MQGLMAVAFEFELSPAEKKAAKFGGLKPGGGRNFGGSSEKVELLPKAKFLLVSKNCIVVLLLPRRLLSLELKLSVGGFFCKSVTDLEETSRAKFR